MARQGRHARVERFNQAALTALEPVTERIVYLDTVQVLLRRPLPRTAKKAFRGMNPGEIRFERSKSLEFPYLIRFHQPSAESILFLAEKIGEHLVNRVDIALDLIVEEQSTADVIHQFLSDHLTQSWRGHRQRRSVDETEYYARAWRDRNIVLYPNRPSKMIQKPTAHVEFRYFKARSCKRIGVTQVSNLFGLNIRSVLSRHHRLSYFEPDKLERNLQNAAGKAVLMHNRRHNIPMRRAEMDQRIRHILARMLRKGDDDLRLSDIEHAPVQLWLDWAPQWSRNAVTHLPFDLLLGDKTIYVAPLKKPTII